MCLFKFKDMNLNLIDKVVAEKKGCEESWHGCCADGVTPARGPGGTVYLYCNYNHI